MTDFISDLATNNVSGVEMSHRTVQPRMRSRFEPSRLAETPPTSWIMDVVVASEVQPASGPPHVPADRADAEAHSRKRGEVPAPSAARPQSAPQHTSPKPTVMRLEQTHEIVERVEHSASATEPVEETPPQPSGHVRGVFLPPAPQGAQAPAALDTPERVTEPRTTASPSEREPGPWIVQPQTIRAEVPAQLDGPVSGPDRRLAPGPAPATPAPPPVQVTIGRVEVRAATPAPSGASQRARSRHAQEALPLEEYLRGSGK